MVRTRDGHRGSHTLSDDNLKVIYLFVRLARLPIYFTRPLSPILSVISSRNLQ